MSKGASDVELYDTRAAVDQQLLLVWMAWLARTGKCDVVWCVLRAFGFDGTVTRTVHPDSRLVMARR